MPPCSILRRASLFDLTSPVCTTAALPAGDGIALVDAVVQTGLVKSKSEARRQIEQGGIYVNQEREKSVERRLERKDLIAGRNLLLRKGKKEYALLRT